MFKFLLLVLGLSSQVWAGETLRFKTGDIDPLRIQARERFLTSVGSKDLEHTIFVVQFAGAPKIETVAAAGAEVINFVPDDALLVKVLSPGILAELRRAPGVRVVVPYLKEWKKSPELLIERGDVLKVSIRLLSAQDLIKVTKALRSYDGVSVIESSEKNINAHVPRILLDRIASNAAVEWIEPYHAMNLFDWGLQSPDVTSDAELAALTGLETGTLIMKFEQAWSRGVNGKGQVVAVVDTGLDTGIAGSLHPDFGNFLEGLAAGTSSTSWGDTNGHGTHVSGSVLGTGTSSNSLIRGGGYGSRLFMEGVMSPDGDFTPPSDPEILFGIPLSKGARIHTNSWGSNRGLGGYDGFAAMVDEYLWNNPDLFVLFAAGNSGVDRDADGVIDPDSISSPGTAKNVLTVGASENKVAVGGVQGAWGQYWAKKYPTEPLKSDHVSNNENGLAAFSSRGPTKDGRLKPDVVAPGTNILSTKSQDPNAGNLWGGFSPMYTYCGGTSMATPLVAGAAAVVRQYLIEQKKVAIPSAALLKAVFVHTAQDIFPGQYGEGPGQEIPTHRPNNVEGYGRVNMETATALADVQVTDQRVGVGNNETQTIKFQMRRAGQLRVTLAYTDAPGLVSAQKALVNDLDLIVIRPNGTVVQKVADHLNNIEMLEVSDATSGEYTVQVRGVSVVKGRAGKQSYSVLVGPY